MLCKKIAKAEFSNVYLKKLAKARF